MGSLRWLMDIREFTLFRYVLVIASWAMVFVGLAMLVIGLLRLDPNLAEVVLMEGGKYSSSETSQIVGGAVVMIFGWLFLRKGKEFFKQA